MFWNSLGKAGLYYVSLSLILLIGTLRVYSARADAEIHGNKKYIHKEAFFTHAYPKIVSDIPLNHFGAGVI